MAISANFLTPASLRARERARGAIDHSKWHTAAAAAAAAGTSGEFLISKSSFHPFPPSTSIASARGRARNSGAVLTRNPWEWPGATHATSTPLARPSRGPLSHPSISVLRHIFPIFGVSSSEGGKRGGFIMKYGEWKFRSERESNMIVCRGAHETAIIFPTSIPLSNEHRPRARGETFPSQGNAKFGRM